jgi:hypothetical protein
LSSSLLKIKRGMLRVDGRRLRFITQFQESLGHFYEPGDRSEDVRRLDRVDFAAALGNDRIAFNLANRLIAAIDELLRDLPFGPGRAPMGPLEDWQDADGGPGQCPARHNHGPNCAWYEDTISLEPREREQGCCWRGECVHYRNFLDYWRTSRNLLTPQNRTPITDARAFHHTCVVNALLRARQRLEHYAGTLRRNLFGIIPFKAAPAIPVKALPAPAPLHRAFAKAAASSAGRSRSPRRQLTPGAASSAEGSRGPRRRLMPPGAAALPAPLVEPQPSEPLPPRHDPNPLPALPKMPLLVLRPPPPPPPR